MWVGVRACITCTFVYVDMSLCACVQLCAYTDSTCLYMRMMPQRCGHTAMAARATLCRVSFIYTCTCECECERNLRQWQMGMAMAMDGDSGGGGGSKSFQFFLFVC